MFEKQLSLLESKKTIKNLDLIVLAETAKKLLNDKYLLFLL